MMCVGWILKPSVNNENYSKWRRQECAAGPRRTERYILHQKTRYLCAVCTHMYTHTEQKYISKEIYLTRAHK